MVRLIVHLGAAKCGSSALQRYFADNHAALRQSGILIPGKRMGEAEVDGHQLWFFENLRPFGPDQQKVFSNRIRQLCRTAEAQQIDTIIISAENLINPNGFHRLFEGVHELAAAEFILYVRRQDDYIISAWQQWYLKRGQPFDLFLERQAGQIANWHEWLLPWEEAVGRERISVRRFGRQYLTDGDIVKDFMTAMALSCEGCSPPTGLANRSFDEAIGRMAARVPDVFKDIHDNRFYDALVYAIGEKALKSRKATSLLSHERRLELLDRYAESNESLKIKYFPHLSSDEPLFSPPDPSESIELTPEQQIEEEHALLIRAVYRMAGKLRALERQAGED